MAQNQKIEYLFAAQVTGQNELQKLTSAVDSLRKEMEALKAASNGVAPAAAGVGAAAQRSAKGLDAAAKAIRNTRQGTQQLGMQFNDLATSISTGASPVQAFNQQIGQMGYAMSLMQGKAGAVGRFLAGPWSILVIGAAMAVGFLFETMNKSEEVNDKFANALSRSRDALFDYQVTLAKTREAVLELYETKLAGLQFEFQKSATAAGKFGGEVRDSQNVLNDFANQPLYKVGKALIVNSRATKEYNEATEKTLDINTEMLQLQNTLAQMRKRHATEDSRESARGLRSAEAAANKLQARNDAELNQANQIAEKIRDMALVYGEASKEVGATKKKLDDFEDSLKKLEKLNGGAAILLELKDSIKLVRESIEQEGAKKALSDLNEEMDKLVKKDLSPFDQRISSLMEKLSAAGGLDKLDPVNKEKFQVSVTAAANVDFDAALEAQRDLLNNALGVDDAFQMQVASLEQIIERMSALGIPTDVMVAKLKEFQALNQDTKMAERNKELKASFEAIGTAVSNSFKGMITGAMSFQSAMKGIIGAVINELFRLYVVQQIVGVVSGALGSIGLPVPALPPKAYGGSVTGKKPYMVGERGPELFIPGGNGTIIPNSNMRGGGGGGSNFNISVDARGASDPAAVRAQVQQGILEAAPAIIAAAESRTISSLRRPRLGGAMQ